ncbi:MAG: Smr/MutS family protein [Chitinophagaceae bacterium]
MKFSIGDAVRLKRTGEEGHILSFLSPGLLEVEVHGLSFPVYEDDLEHPYLNWFTEKKKAIPKKKLPEILPEKPENRVQRLARGIYLSFLPQFSSGQEEEVIECFKIFLLNETADALELRYDLRAADKSKIFQHSGSIHAFGNIYLHQLSLEEMNAQPRFHWEFKIQTSTGNPVKGILRLRPSQLVKYIQELLAENLPSFSILLANDAQAIPTTTEPNPVFFSGNTFNYSPTKSSGHSLVTVAQSVVDLHIKVIAPETHKLPKDAILDYQLKHLQKMLQAALVAGLPQMIVIHGLGKGILKQEVHKLLSTHSGVHSFKNEWMPKYGWGATRVIL